MAEEKLTPEELKAIKRAEDIRAIWKSMDSPIETDSRNVIAALRMRVYEAHLRAGFTPDQSLWLAWKLL